MVSNLSSFLLLAITPSLTSIRTSAANPTPLHPYSEDTQNANHPLSATSNPASNNDIQTHNHGQGAERSSIATLTPRSLSWSDVTGNWSLVCNDWEAFPASSTTVEALSDMYLSISNTLVRTRPEITPANVLSLTYGGLRLTFQAILQTVPWGVVEGLLRRMRDLTRAGLTGLYTVVVYFLIGSIIWSGVLIVLIALPIAREGVTSNLIA